MLNRPAIKSEAKSLVKSAQASAYVFTLLFLVISFVLSLFTELISGSTAAQVTTMMEDFGYSITAPMLRLPIPTALSTFVLILISLMMMLLNAGYVVYHLGIRSRQRMPYSTMFDGFAFAGKVIALNLVVTAFVTLWTMLFIIPGFIAAYRYRYALYNLCDDPSVGVMEALRMSKAQTRGHKWELFVLDLSFLGWMILCSLTLNILSIWIMPYINQTDVGYFVRLKQLSGVGYIPPEHDGTFHVDERFSDGNGE